MVEKVTVSGVAGQTGVPQNVQSTKKCRIVPTTDFAEKEEASFKAGTKEVKVRSRYLLRSTHEILD